MIHSMKKFVDLEDELHEAAMRQTGLADFGDPAYRPALRALLHAYDTDAKLTQTGWRFYYHELLQILIARLYAQKGWAEHPDVLAIPIRRPLVITGFQRTGTTALHKLLAVDRQFQGLELWLAHRPMIRPPREMWETHPDFRACKASAEALHGAVPEFSTAHELIASDVEDCLFVLRHSFVFRGFSLLLPTYESWFGTQTMRDSYRRYADVLRLIGGHEPQARWLLRAPDHLSDIDALLEVFPDACIVRTHRDPLKAIPSFCSLLSMQRQVFETDAARPEHLGPVISAYWRKTLDRMEEARRRRSPQIFDLDHRSFVADPLGTVRRIYDSFGLSLSADTEQRMRAWVAASPTTRHGEHRYNMNTHGINEAQIRDTFAEYRERHQFN